MRAEQADQDIFEALLRRTITQSVIDGLDHAIPSATVFATLLQHHAWRARKEQLSPQTLQVIASARRLLGNRAPRRLDP
ncbi:hypothetical protein OICFNHDK_3272 [Methylobacterium bullatum]|uniref:Uncharacterized protein n=2 Tax=Methylobacterium bullatum TaxID=570505 RepID=A0AAV4ZAF7_9HYPH|nr:hypothetical protein [Methylobacterium bullatum]GJD40797.1 hypothetical protein OICFNHDK_3272 [Methylobacterium bullatum]